MENQDNFAYPDLGSERRNTNIHYQWLCIPGSQRVSTPGAIKLYSINRRDEKVTEILPSFEYRSYFSDEYMHSPVGDDSTERNQNIKEYYGDDYEYYEKLARGVMNMKTTPPVDDSENYNDYNSVQHIIDHDEAMISSFSIPAISGLDDAESYIEGDEMDYLMDPSLIYLNPIEGCSTILERKRNTSQPLEGNQIQSPSPYHVSSPSSPGYEWNNESAQNNR